MSKIAKGQLTVDGNSIHVSMPFAKVDKDKRLVSGWATLDNIDSQDDVVSAQASSKAFARARGNIREMHQPIAAGRMVDFREDTYFDNDTKKVYSGIYVTARVSEGAEDTWKKVLDGTLTGFSIGGDIVDADQEFSKDAGKNVRVIKDYNLVELSLVDNPANQLANVLSIQKSATGSVMKGMIAETTLSNVFVCTACGHISIVETEESAPCPIDGSKMENAGWYEEGDDRAEKVDEIVTKFLNPVAKEAAPISDEGGVDMDKAAEVTPEVDPEGTAPEVDAVVEEEAVVDETEGTEETTEEDETAAPEEVADEETEISKQIDALHKAIEDTLANTKGEFTEQVEELKKFVAEQVEPLVTKTSELEGRVNEFGQRLEVNKGMIAEMESRLEKMNALDALKKSGDLDEETQPEPLQKSIWSPGAFSGKKQFFSATDL
jgi:hypothetical protein